jgi:hypothetical protein
MNMQSAFVHIIESPSANDLLDGRTEGRSLSEILNLAGTPYCYNLVTNLETFDIALNKRLLDAFKKGKCQLAPILHLSMHGDENGIALTDDTVLSWDNLRELLTPLNNEMEGGLLICISSCFGSNGIKMAMHDTDQPFWALVGNNSSVSWEDAAVAYVTFYHLFFKGILVEQCVERMKWASNDNRFDCWSGHEVKANWTEYTARFRQKRDSELIRRAGQVARQRINSFRQNRY